MYWDTEAKTAVQGTVPKGSTNTVNLSSLPHCESWANPISWIQMKPSQMRLSTITTWVPVFNGIIKVWASHLPEVPTYLNRGIYPSALLGQKNKVEVLKEIRKHWGRKGLHASKLGSINVYSQLKKSNFQYFWSTYCPVFLLLIHLFSVS